MMRSRWRSLASLTGCGLLAFVASVAGASRTAQGAKAAERASHARPLTRTWSMTSSPRPNDLALVEIGFPKARRGLSISRRTLRVAASAPFGDDYVALAAPIARAHGYPRALVVVVNRPSPLEDPVDVRLRATARRALGKPLVWKLANPFSQPHPGLTPALCDLRLHGSTSSGSDLLALGSQGAPLAGFGVATAVAQAYDVACGLPYDSSFAQVVTGSPAPAPSPAPTPVPPEQPVGKLPGEGCVPRPGYACPGVVSSGLPTPARDGLERAPTRVSSPLLHSTPAQGERQNP